ncbi:DMT family transporter [Gemmata sp. JC717]|uniref:DMT family transporter n=1 Tax=Gemmata algarum TaxID=2975278 RepID=A0ABU5F899_9BACT|nr:DMT family transporter [Gemmata algarum]MDY3554032.1 DMT family transporter [Gemmata algarum]MDY3562982.1 DMT family transporter [Gemmata algarum]
MNIVVFALLAAGAGACIALQASANGNFRKNLGDNPLAAAYLSICGTIVTATLAVLLLRPRVPEMTAVRETPWWNWIGGPLGALIVLAGAALAPRLGAALFIALVVAGQLICSLALDHFGLMGLAQQALTPGRVLGAVLVVAGVVCVKFL